MAYRQDIDLEFLGKAAHEELKFLADLLIYDPKDDKTRWTEELSKKLRNCTNYHVAWKDIAGELQCFGANTFTTLFRRGQGVLYKEILCDCCDKLQVNYNKNSSVSTIEEEYLKKMLEKSWDSMNSEERKNFLKPVNTLLYTQNIKEVTNLPGLLGLLGLNELIGYLLSRTIICGPIVFSSAGAFLGSSLLAGSAGLIGGSVLYTGAETLVATQVLGRAATMINPLDWAFNAFAAYQIAGPAYRVTIPACTIIAVLRKKYELSAKEALRLDKYGKLAAKLQANLEQKEVIEKKCLGCYAFGKKIISLANNTISEMDLELPLFGSVISEIKELTLKRYDNLQEMETLQAVAHYAATQLHCDKELLKLLTDWMLINANDTVKNKIENEFSQLCF